MGRAAALALAMLLLAGALSSATKPVTQLQIGVRKRPSECDVKSKQGDLVAMHYTGKLYTTGEEFDSSLPRGEPFKFTLGQGHVIKGWDRGLLGMCIGEVRKLVIPAEMAYGELGAPPQIPPNMPLVFEVELLNIERREEL